MSCGLFDLGCHAVNFGYWLLGVANWALDGVPWYWVIPSMIFGAVLGIPGTAMVLGGISAIRFAPRHPREAYEHVAGKDAHRPVRQPPKGKGDRTFDPDTNTWK